MASNVECCEAAKWFRQLRSSNASCAYEAAGCITVSSISKVVQGCTHAVQLHVHIHMVL